MTPVLAFLGGIVGQLFEDWKAGRANKREVEKAVTENRIRMALDREAHNAEWEMRALEGRDTFLRRASFVGWTWPIVWAAIDPSGAARFFNEALAVLPDWYVGGYLGITGAVWGLAELKALGVLKK